ncbi:MAG: hypothetical protein KKA19_04375 [Candidatus Margulisbacteria bacterium]|nr:hypothetical protein [Candidatus Margulisiibacteriota bacterium]
MLEFFKEFIEFIKERKLLIIAPIIIILLIVGVLIFITANSAVAPFIYTLF